MTLLFTLAHILIPRRSNNFKAKLLHAEYLLTLAMLLLVFKLSLSSSQIQELNVLGYAANISTAKVVEITNQKRINNGLSELTVSPSLEAAAREKGLHMLEHNYWAHVAPDGTEPWYFFENVGYDYRYAGENLARDFSNESAAIEAWMASPTHRDNMLSGKYNEIGIAVVEGDLNGVDTTIIIQLFGTKAQGTIPAISVASANIEEGQDTVNATKTPQVTVEAGESDQFAVPPQGGSVEKGISVSPFTLLRTTSLAIVAILGIVLIIDIIIISQRKVVRKTSKPLAHISFLSMIIILILLAQSGSIL